MIKVAQLGAGRMGAIHARNAAANPRLNLVALVDPRPEVAGPLAQELGARLASFDEVLADPEIQGIIVASSTDAHLDNALSALRRVRSSSAKSRWTWTWRGCWPTPASWRRPRASCSSPSTAASTRTIRR
jgi:3-hydroxyisobutyrate dehydrogenase-like beta-hydroxyacid dehydrogenase